VDRVDLSPQRRRQTAPAAQPDVEAGLAFERPHALDGVAPDEFDGGVGGLVERRREHQVAQVRVGVGHAWSRPIW
jgi:hypothetical protein